MAGAAQAASLKDGPPTGPCPAIAHFFTSVHRSHRKQLPHTRIAPKKCRAKKVPLTNSAQNAHRAGETRGFF
jgi:hypothetical protein